MASNNIHYFKPAFGLGNRHLQTLYSSFFRKSPELDIDIETFELEDGDFVECFWFNKPKENTTNPIVVIFHGLEGSYKSPYIQGIMKALKQNDFACVLMHFRSCSGKVNRKARSYHSGDTQDAKAWIKYLSKKYRSNKLFAIGYSLGGNMLLKLLGECGKGTSIKAAVSVSAPLQLDISADVMNQGFALIYQNHLLNLLKNSLLLKYKYHDIKSLTGINEEEVKQIKTIREFDDKFTAKINGFGNVENYYNLCSAKQYLKDIKIDTLIIHALDDPFMNKEILPEEKELSSSIKLEVHKKGGHLGFISGSIFNPEYWLEQRIISYFKNF